MFKLFLLEHLTKCEYVYILQKSVWNQEIVLLMQDFNYIKYFKKCIYLMF